jgi:thiamine-phosphate pyrophosphorylase
MVMDSQLPRILDANANRAREGLRTAEDYVRFIVGDMLHAERLRIVRQALTATLLSIPDLERALIEARNVVSDPFQPENWKDVLRRVESETPLDVARRGLKRAQEALRVLEEYLRAAFPQQAERFSKLRYGVYEAEQWLIGASSAMLKLVDAKVYVLLTAAFCKNKDLLKTAQAVLRAGIKVIQLREKEQSDAALLPVLSSLQTVCAEHDAILFSNDRVDLAMLAGTHGVHLGQTDITPTEARKLSGRRLLIGRSTHSVDQARNAIEIEKADYIGIGAMFDTTSKSKLILSGLKLAEDVAALKLNAPVFAIGGITLERLPALKSAGVTRVAVTQAIIGSTDPEYEARKFIEVMST